MQRAVVIRGRLVGPTTVELDEPVADPNVLGPVEVLLRLPPSEVPDAAETLIDFLERLPIASRSKADIDRQMHDERASWD